MHQSLILVLMGAKRERLSPNLHMKKDRQRGKETFLTLHNCIELEMEAGFEPRAQCAQSKCSFYLTLGLCQEWLAACSLL